MSAKKSWDIQPRARRAAPEPARPAARAASPRSMQEMRAKPRAAAPIEKPTPVSKRNVTIARGKKARPEAKEPLKKRRKKAKKALAIVLLITAALLLALMTYLAWLPALRVSAVSADGPHAAEVEQIARQALYGTHAYVLPRNSLFFIPERDIRARVLEAFPDIEAVSIRPQGLTALSVSVVPRAEAYIWCGTARETPEESCYSANAAGLIFAPLSPETASTSEALRVYAPIEGQQDASPVRAHIARGENIPEALRFVKAMQELGADVTALAFRGDEGDVYTVAGTRITYVLGREQEAAGIAASVFPQLSLNDGSVAYVDLRFSGKAYFKRAAPAPEESE